MVLSRSPGPGAALRHAVHGVALASGFAGLGYEMVWTRALAVALGHEIVSVLAVLAAFFTGMAIGAWMLHGPLSRARRPALWYAALEVLIGVWALVLTFLMPAVCSWALAGLPPAPSPLQHWVFAFGLPLLLLLPATFAMGATLPALERWLSQLREDGWVVAGVYGANTSGAALGVLLSTFVLVPTLGYTYAAWSMAMINLSCAAAAIVLGHRATPAESRPDQAPMVGVDRRPKTRGLSDAPVGMLWILFVTGLLGIGLEVLVVRVLSQVLENTVYTFAALLVVYLTGTAIGAALYHRFGNRGHRFAGTAAIMTFASLSCLFAVGMLAAAGDLYPIFRGLAGPDPAGAFVAEVGVAALVFLPATLAMGALFSHLTQEMRDRRHTIGRAFAVNTLGGALAPLLFGVLILPTVGAKGALIGVALGYAVLIAVAQRRPTHLLLPGAIATGLMLAPVSLRIVSVPRGGAVLFHSDGVMASVSVVGDARGHRHLKVNDRYQMGGTSSVYSDRRQGHIPLLLHPAPHRALFLGLGAGVTFAAAQDYPGLRAQAVELVPEVVDALPYFDQATGPIRQDTRLKIHVADARRFVAAADRPYDVVVADLFHPARDGAAGLYTREHFEAIRRLLGEDGLFCQWLPLYQMDRRTLATIMRTFLDVFPNASAWLAHYSIDAPILGLIGSRIPLRLPPDWVEQRIRDGRHRAALEAIRLDDPLELPGAFIGSARSLAQFAGPGPVNTDDRPVVLFQAPELAYRDRARPVRLLLDVVGSIDAPPGDLLLLSDDDDGTSVARLAAYWAARGRFLAIGATIRPTRDPRLLLARVRDPLLEVLHISPDFTPAYRPLAALATKLRDREPFLARSLLRQLESLAPNAP